MRGAAREHFNEFAREPNVGVVREAEARRENANDGGGLVTDFQLDGGKILRAAERLLPVGVADQRDGGSVEALVVGFEAAAEDRLNAHDLKEVF
jgi:hypothetical protein